MKRKAIGRDVRRKMRTYAWSLERMDRYTYAARVYDTRYETDEIGNNNGRGRGGERRRRRGKENSEDYEGRREGGRMEEKVREKKRNVGS